MAVCSVAPTQSTLGIQSMDASVGVTASRLAFFARKGESVSLHADVEGRGVASLEICLDNVESLPRSLHMGSTSAAAMICTLLIMKVVTLLVTCADPTTTIAYTGCCGLREERVKYCTLFIVQ